MRKYTVKDRFIKYVQIDTQADPYSDTAPSTSKQLNMTKLLAEELEAMGIPFETTDQGYVYARVPANTTKKDVPSIFFCAHVDTAYDCSGTNVKPIVHSNYQGGPIVLPDDNDQVINQEKFPELKNKVGHDIITASGLTLLGADDKSGVACIMDAAYQMMNDPSIEHGEVVLFFTTDEEIGRGTDFVDIEKIGCSWGYTLDSGDVGHFEYENFSANAATLKIQGVSAHPGYGKGKIKHAAKIAADILSKLPKDRLSPETTSGREGFVHPNKVLGMIETATIDFIIRDFDTARLKDHEQMIVSIAEEVMKEYDGASFTFEVREQYRNMRDVIEKHPHVVEYVEEAMQRLNISLINEPIRGGTDGAMLSHKGLPCPNIFSGQHGIHSKLEWTTVQDMQAAVDVILEICKITEESAS